MFLLCSDIKVCGENFSSADVDDQAADRIDAGTVAGIEHDRRRDFLDDRRPGDLIAGEERLAMPDRRLLPSAAARSLRLEIDPARPWRASCGGSRPPEGGRGNSGVSMRPVAVTAKLTIS